MTRRDGDYILIAHVNSFPSPISNVVFTKWRNELSFYETRSFSLMIEIHRKSIVWVCRNQYRSRRIFNQFFQVDLYWKFVWKSQSWARRRRKTLTMTSIFSCKNRKKFWDGRDVVGTIWMILPQYATQDGGWFQIMTRPGMYVWKLTKSTMCLYHTSYNIFSCVKNCFHIQQVQTNG